jgi:hypothetical protein
MAVEMPFRWQEPVMFCTFRPVIKLSAKPGKIGVMPYA